MGSQLDEQVNGNLLVRGAGRALARFIVGSAATASMVQTSTDPNGGAGVAAELGSIAFQTTSGQWWQKTGAGDTAWTQVTGGGGISGTIITPSSITGTVNNYSPVGWYAQGVRQAVQAGGATLTGLNAAVLPGGLTTTLVELFNRGTDFLTLSNENAGSLAANRFNLPGSRDFSIAPDGCALLFYDTTSARWRLAGYSGQDFIAAGFTGVIPFAGNTGVLETNASGLFRWDDAALALVIGAASAIAPNRVTVVGNVTVDSVLALKNLHATGLAALSCFDEAGVIKLGVGYDNASNQNYFEFSGADINLHDDITSPTGAGDIFRFTPSGAFEFTRYNTPAVAAATKARLALGTGAGANKLQLSLGSSPAGAAYFDVATWASALTSGAVLFANNANQATFDAANLFWNAATLKFGINVGNAPADSLHVGNTVADSSTIRMQGLTNTSYSSLVVVGENPGAVFQGGMFWGNSNVATVAFRNKLFLYSAAGANWNFSNPTRDQFTVGMTAGRAFWQLAQGNAELGTVSAANTAKFVYDEVANQVKVSKNGGAYAVLI